MKEVVQDRVEGLAQGLMIGDLMGSPFEGMDLGSDPLSNPVIASVLSNPKADKQWRNWAEATVGLVEHVQGNGGLVDEYLGELNQTYLEAGETTDDSSKAVTIMQSIVDAKGINRFSLARAYVEWYQGGATKGVGGTSCLMLAEQDPVETEAIIDPYDSSKLVRMRGQTWYAGWGQRERNKKLGKPSHKWLFSPHPANGAEMSIAVVALSLLDENVSQADINKASDTVTCITHPYIQCYQTSRAITTLARDLVMSGDLEYAVTKAEEQYPKIIEASQKSLQADRPYTGGNLETFAIAFEALRSSSSYKETVVKAINATTTYGSWASDSDTYGAVAGALAGAAYGSSSIPENWARPRNKEGDTIAIKPVSFEEMGRLAVKIAIL